MKTVEDFKVEAKVYVGAVVDCGRGGWITLPMETSALQQQIDSFAFGESEYMILETESEMPIDFHRYANPFDLNRDLHLFSTYEERGQLRLLLTAFAYRNEDLEDAIDFLEEGNYEYYEEVTDEESLGHAIVHGGAFGWMLGMPEAFEHLPEVKQMAKRNILQVTKIKQYLDFEAIGRDFVCSGGILYGKGLNTGIRETAK